MTAINFTDVSGKPGSHLVLNQCVTDSYAIYHGDSVVVLRALPDSSIGMVCTSIPFLDLYVYTDSERDVGNSTIEQFWEHLGLIFGQLIRVMKPGRIVCIDVQNVPAMLCRDGYIGVKDLRGHTIYAMEECGFIFHSEFVTWRDPLLEMQRTKALRLLHKQLCKDSSRCGAGMPSWLICFRKPGDNEEPIAHPNGVDHWVGFDEPDPTKYPGDKLSHQRWQRIASPVWTDINVADTLNVRAARHHDDAKHVCAMPLQIIERALFLYSNPDDIVLDPFGGIGSTVYQARRMDPPRRGISIELKESYYKASVVNISKAVQIGLPGIL